MKNCNLAVQGFYTSYQDGDTIEKEIGKRGPIDSGDILALKSEADGEGEMLDGGKIL